MEQKVEGKKLSYEELENVAHQLSAQAQQLQVKNQQLVTALEQSNLGNLYKRLDYLFEVINRDNKYLSSSFKERCAKEIEELMASPENPEEENLKDKE